MNNNDIIIVVIAGIGANLVCQMIMFMLLCSLIKDWSEAVISRLTKQIQGNKQ